MRDGAFNFHVDPVRMEMTGMQQILISHICDLEILNQKGSLRTKIYRKSVLQTRANQKTISLMKILRMRENQKPFTKLST